jgi:hypothetical protein
VAEDQFIEHIAPGFDAIATSYNLGDKAGWEDLIDDIAGDFPDLGKSISTSFPAASAAGHGFWLESMPRELEDLAWSSDRQGELGRGRSLRVTLAPGHHRLTLRAGSDARAGETSLEVDVDARPA